MKKQFYTIAEAADKTGISMSKIRFWEKEIPQLKPHRNEQQTRFYTIEDIELIKNIIFLQNNNLTLEGIREKLRSKNNFDDLSRKRQISDELNSIRDKLKGLLKLL
ncbi:MAG: MerR family transcriptional regulator [Paludibacter sp.]|nr:MerR family transcriptional regulator [Paludibacter sp.]